MKLPREVVYRYLAIEPLLAISRASVLRDGAVSLMYHEVLPDYDSREAWTVVTESSFRAQMRYMATKFAILSLDDALDGMRAPRRRGLPPALVTFDDGYLGNRDVVWPIIETMRIPITIFVSTSVVEGRSTYWYDRVIAVMLANPSSPIDLRHLGLDTYRMPDPRRPRERWTHIQRLLTDLKRLPSQGRDRAVLHLEETSGACTPEPLRVLSIEDVGAMARSRYITFGAHSHGHEILTQLSGERVRETVLRSKTLLESWTARPVRHFAYPNGDYNDEIARIVSECGFVSSQAAKPGLWRRGDSPLAIPRLGIGRFDSLGWFKARVSGLVR